MCILYSKNAPKLPKLCCLLPSVALTRRVPEGIDVCAQPWIQRPIVAFDGMCVSFHLLHSLPAIMPLVSYALAKESEEEGA